MLRNSNLLAVVEKVVHMMRCICTCKICHFQSTFVILYLLCSSLTVGNIVPSELSWERSCLKEAFLQFHLPKVELQSHLSVVLYCESKLVRRES